MFTKDFILILVGILPRKDCRTKSQEADSVDHDNVLPLAKRWASVLNPNEKLFYKHYLYSFYIEQGKPRRGHEIYSSSGKRINESAFICIGLDLEITSEIYIKCF